MLPGLVAGHYTPRKRTSRSRRWRCGPARAFVADRVVALDLHTKTATLSSGHREPFDLMSLDVGSTPDVSIPGARGTRLRSSRSRHSSPRGAGSRRMRRPASCAPSPSSAAVPAASRSCSRCSTDCRALGMAAPRFALITDQPCIAAAATADGARACSGRILVERGVVLHLQSGATAVEPGAVIVDARPAHRRRPHRLGDRGRRAAVAGRRRTRVRRTRLHRASTITCARRRTRSCSPPAIARRSSDIRGRSRASSPCARVRRSRPTCAVPRTTRRCARYVPQRHALALISTGGQHAIGVAWSVHRSKATGCGAGRTGSIGASSQDMRCRCPRRTCRR